jgi:hypothetical protein
MPKAKVIQLITAQPPPETWDDPMWWYGEVRKLPGVVCPRCDHAAFAKYWVTGAGRQIGYSCPMDGWERVILVQDGWGVQPQVPHDGQGVSDPPIERQRARARLRKRRGKMAKKMLVEVAL